MTRATVGLPVPLVGGEDMKLMMVVAIGRIVLATQDCSDIKTHE
jgi:hypothetical protein